ncbi:pyridine nucleotide-disulfide oxidoreductase family protein [Wolbachia endosymbiont of Glossina morsitans morsitans]|nr:pyridine nucleotide-disulfide oxidoreductase family protein [Wolbachia endosymbiont of Glossina morsitans morsitans]
MIHGRKKFRCTPETRNKLESLEIDGKIELVVPYQLHELAAGNGQLSAVIVKNIASKEEKEISADFLLPFFGLSMNLDPINNWGIQLEHGHIAVDPTTLKTSRDRIYAIGDIATYSGKLKLILSGFAESAMACYDIYAVIHNSRFNFQYSTSKGIHRKEKLT